MKKVLALICLVCLSVSVFAACSGAPSNPEELVGKTYVFDDLTVEFGDSLSDAQKETAEKMWNENKDTMLEQYKAMELQFAFKENGVVEASAMGEEEKGTYEIKDGKWYITMDGEAQEVEFSGNSFIMSNDQNGMILMLKFVLK